MAQAEMTPQVSAYEENTPAVSLDRTKLAKRTRGKIKTTELAKLPTQTTATVLSLPGGWVAMSESCYRELVWVTEEDLRKHSITS